MQEKIELIYELLEKVGDSWTESGNLKQIMDSNPSEQIINEIFDFIAEVINDTHKQLSLEGIDILQKKIEKIKQKEEMERQKEQAELEQMENDFFN